MHPVDLFRITNEVEEYMQRRKSKRLVYNVVNALDKLGYLNPVNDKVAQRRAPSDGDGAGAERSEGDE
jgi:hypothetical protein